MEEGEEEEETMREREREHEDHPLTLKKASLSSLRAPMGFERSRNVAGLLRSDTDKTREHK